MTARAVEYFSAGSPAAGAELNSANELPMNVRVARMSVSKAFLLPGPLLFLWFTLWASPAGAATVSLEQVNTTVALAEDGSALISETIESQAFPASFERTIPLVSDSPLGPRRLLVEILEITDRAGDPLACRIRRSDSALVIEVLNAAHDITLTYKIRNAVRFFADSDEFYWPANPPGTNIRGASVWVQLPRPAAGEFTAQAFLQRDSGVPLAAQWSSDGRVPVQTGEREIRAIAPGPLTPGVTMVVDLVAAKGLFRTPGIRTRMWRFVSGNPILLLPVAVLAWLLALRRWKNRVMEHNPDTFRSIGFVYAPPAGLTPAECGALIEDDICPRDITATFIDLAARGYIRIEDAAPQQGLLVGRRDFVFQLLKPPAEWKNLTCYERTMLSHIFYGGSWTLLSNLRLRLPDIVPLMRRQLFLVLRQRGIYRVDPSRIQIWRQLSLGAVAAVLIGLQQRGFGLFNSPVLACSAIATSALIVFWLGRSLTAKTLTGMRTCAAVLGLRNFIAQMDADQIQDIGADFERLLPYAVALGVDFHWTGAFHGLAAKPPEWYGWEEGKAFDSVLLGHKLDLLSTAVVGYPGALSRRRARLGPSQAAHGCRPQASAQTTEKAQSASTAEL